ncbi:hypothetical protein Egran_02565 [Elaphomyces granulatus]|uniref:Transglutaminase-like domain-containing protein n=1 Tax=Elaphomyces granulatus TaxID=519963 RepID=A0A232LZS7_9EURO|nr:hypothetical protein Egran_02565 [Elaphomyces granulatus]
MTDRSRSSHNGPAPRAHDLDVAQLTEEFKTVMQIKRFDSLQAHSRSQSPVPSQSSSRTSRPPAYQPQQQPQESKQHCLSAVRNLPIMPAAPQSTVAKKFRNNLLVLSATPMQYENPGLLDEALSVIPLDRVYAEAEDDTQFLQAQAASLGRKPEWGYQDCVIKSLLKWFRESFFKYVNNPECSRCRTPTLYSGRAPPTPEETARSASMVELYLCANSQCGTTERFPRYSDVWQALKTRRGRSGEWANCFTMLCKAVGSRVRWVWNSEDYVWTEVYSERQKRWVHVDACEGVWDQPRLYTEGWTRKVAYCIAFSVDGATDVTRRYVRLPDKYGAARSRAPEEALLWSIQEIRDIRRKNLPKNERDKLQKEDEREEKELRAFSISAIAGELGKLRLDGKSTTRSDDQKTPVAAQEGAADLLRSEHGGTGHSGPDRSGSGR